VDASLDRTLPKVDNDARRRYVALDLNRLDGMLETFYKRAIEKADAQAPFGGGSSSAIRCTSGASGSFAMRRLRSKARSPRVFTTSLPLLLIDPRRAALCPYGLSIE
jgi:hypothetical protein